MYIFDSRKKKHQWCNSFIPFYGLRLPIGEDQNDALFFQEYHWQNEFGSKFGAVQLAINDIDPLMEDNNFGTNFYLKLKEKKYWDHFRSLGIFCTSTFWFKGYVCHILKFAEMKKSWKWQNTLFAFPFSSEIWDFVFSHIEFYDATYWTWN